MNKGFAMPDCPRLSRPPTALSPLRLLRRLADLAALSLSRRALLRLDDHLLRDIGLTRPEAEAATARPAWATPPHRQHRKADSFAHSSASCRLK
jgi:uncharacterized protein YjiS (DUF1127 family)